MEVLEQEHQGRLGGEGGEVPPRGQEDLTPDRVGFEPAHAFAKLSGDLEAEEPREVREDRINVLAEQSADPLLDLRPALRFAVAIRDPRVRADHFEEWQIADRPSDRPCLALEPP